jgi:hypothetical protein
MDDRSNHQKRGSRTLALLALAFWVMGLVNGGRMVQSVRNVSLLADWEPSLSPWVLVVSSAVWAAAFLAVGGGLWKRRGWGRRWGVLLPPLYGLYSAGMILAFTRSPYARGRWAPVALGWMVGSVICARVLTRARLRALFEGWYTEELGLETEDHGR